MDRHPSISELTIRTVADTPPDKVLVAFAAAFAGYSVPITLTPPQFESKFRSEHLDPFASYVYSIADEPAAILFIARRGWVSRVAAMGVATTMRGSGLGLEVMRRAVSEARTRGDARLVLEVIQGNARAVKLYQRTGFDIVRPLLGFSLDRGSFAPSSAAPMREVDPAQGALRAGAFGMPDLPWQVQTPTLAAMVRPTRCLIDATDSIVAMVDASHEAVRLRAVAFDSSVSAAQAASFTASLRTLHPDRGWFAPPLFTDVHRARFFEPGGWTTVELRQFEMSHRLD